MSQEADTPPAVVLKGLADFDTVEAWEKDLVERITRRLSWKVNHPSSNWAYEIDQDIDLQSFDSERIDQLLLGRFFDAETSDWNSDYHHEKDVEVIKDESGAVFEMFAVEIMALAEATDCDVDDLQEKWLDSNEFSPGEMECNVHFDKNRYIGEISARSELAFNLTLDVTGDNLWSSLEFFRINPSDFLAAAQKDISDLAADADGKITEDSFDALKKWSFSLDDIDESDENSSTEQNAAAIYTEKFLARQAEIQSHRLCSLNKWAPGDSAISPESLIAYVKEHAYGNDNDITTYLQICLDESTINGFSTRCARHDFYTDRLPVTVLSGYLTNEASPGYQEDYIGNIKLVKPVTINVNSISIDQDQSPEKGSDTLLMPPALELYADLYEVLLMKRESWIGPLDPSDAGDQQRIEKAISLLEGHSKFVVASALTQGDLGGFKEHAQEFISKRATMFDQDELDRTLVSMLENFSQESIQPAEVKEIDLLISMGARGDFVNTEGANAFILAAKSLVPLPLLRSIGQITDLPNSGIEGKGNAFTLTLKSLSYKGVMADDQSKQAFTQRMSWMLDQGIGLTSKALAYPKQGELTILERLDDGVIVVAALNQFSQHASAEEIQRLKDTMFYQAAITGKDSLAGHLVSAGANVDAVSRSLSTPCNLEEAVDQFAPKNSWDTKMPQKINAIKAMARSARLRNSAMSLIDEIENDMPLAPCPMRP